MTKKDYIKIAEVLKHSTPAGDTSETPWEHWTWIVSDMSSMLARDNPLFDRARFYQACGLEG